MALQVQVVVVSASGKTIEAATKEINFRLETVLAERAAARADAFQVAPKGSQLLSQQTCLGVEPSYNGFVGDCLITVTLVFG